MTDQQYIKELETAIRVARENNDALRVEVLELRRRVAELEVTNE